MAIRAALKDGLKRGIKRVLKVRLDTDPAESHAPPAPARTAPPPPPPVRAEAPPPPSSPVAEPAPPPVVVAPSGGNGTEAPPASPPAAASPTDDTAGPVLDFEAVQAVLDEMVRPAVQGDGGDIHLLRVEDNNIYVKLVGSCSSCPSSIMTLRMGVEALLKEEFPAMHELVQVD